MIFPGRFDPDRWHRVLRAMSVVRVGRRSQDASRARKHRTRRRRPVQVVGGVEQRLGAGRVVEPLQRTPSRVMAPRLNP